MSQNMQAIRRALRPTKKKVIVLAAVAVVAVGGTLAWRHFAGQKNSALPAGAGAGTAGERTVVLGRGTLNDSITVTGTVQSGSTANVTTQLTYPVKEILVQVGDPVSEGDVIARLDSGDLEKELAKKQQSAGEDAATAKENYDKAAANLATAQTKLAEAQAAYATASSNLEALRAKFLPAQSSVSSFQNTYDIALAAEQKAGQDLNNANGALATAQVQAANAQAALDAAADDAARAAAQSQLDAANAAIANAQAALPGLQSAYDTAVAVRKQAENNLNNAKSTCDYDTLYQNYSAADQAWQQAKTTYETAQNSVTQCQDSLSAAKKQLDSGATSDAIEELQEKLDDCVITATASGTVTSIGATVGSAINQGTIATIQDTQHLKVAVTIDEDDIKKVAVGQKAVIKSDATGDEEIAGTVTQVSVTAGQSGGFSAEITVDNTDSGLLVGLSAKAEIIFSQTEGVYTVPYDAVEQDEDGNDVIYVQDGGDWKAVPVQRGKENDYYVEVSGEGLADGMVVRVPIGETGTIDGAGMQDMMGAPVMMDGGTTVTVAPAAGADMGGPGGDGGPRGG